MKKILFFLSLFLPISVYAISAESAVVMDMDSKRVLYSLNSSKVKLIASTTKIMTAIIAIENGSLEEEITVDEQVLKAYGSAIYIEVGEKITLKDLLYGLMLRSGNDAAIVIANAIAGSMQDFTNLMNEKAKELNMQNTKFLNAHGLEENDGNGNTSTAYDMALLMSYAMQNDIFKMIVSTKEYTAKTSTKTYHWDNKNRLLEEYEYTTGGKTGFTQKARRTLVTSASKEGKNLVVVTLNDGNDFSDHKSLYETFFKEYEKVTVLDKNNFDLEDDSIYKAEELYLKNSYQMLVRASEKSLLHLEVSLNKTKPKKTGELVGNVSVYLKDEKITTQNIYYQKEEKEETFSWWQKFVRWIKAW